MKERRKTMKTTVCAFLLINILNSLVVASESGFYNEGTSHLKITKVMCKFTNQLDEEKNRVLEGRVETSGDLGGGRYILNIKGTDADNAESMCESLKLALKKNIYVSLSISNQKNLANTDISVGNLEQVIFLRFND
jgi:hypothetical protein